MIQNSALGQSQGDQAWTRAVQGQGRQVIRRGSMPVPRYYNLAEDGFISDVKDQGQCTSNNITRLALPL